MKKYLVRDDRRQEIIMAESAVKAETIFWRMHPDINFVNLVTTEQPLN
jgi:hypothetical protein